MAQLGIDSYLQHDWSGITGNPVKLALSNFSMFFDTLFMVQHYWLYRGAKGKEVTEAEIEGGSEEDPLLENGRNRDY